MTDTSSKQDTSPMCQHVKEEAAMVHTHLSSLHTDVRTGLAYLSEEARRRRETSPVLEGFAYGVGFSLGVLFCVGVGWYVNTSLKNS